MFNLRKSYWFMLFIYVLTCTPLTIPLCAMAKGTINQPHTKMIFLKPEVRRQPDAFRIDLPEPIMRSPIVMSFYSLSGVKVFEQTLVLDTPALAIELGVLSEQLARLPTGYYFYDLQHAALWWVRNGQIPCCSEIFPLATCRLKQPLPASPGSAI